MPTNSLIVAVDLAPIKAIPRVISFQSDITTDKCRSTIRGHLKHLKADCVLHDGAPNVGTAWVQDAFTQAELVLQSMKLATEFLSEGGTFVTKIFRSKDYNNLLWVFNQLFTKVDATKPPSSRNVSAEIFVVCRGYKAPKTIDPRFLDPRSVFAELSDPTPNNEAKVFNPEVKKRQREGYEEGNYTQFKEVPASDFIQTADPIDILGSTNKLSFEQPKDGDVALAALDKLPITTLEIRNCCADLKVLGRKEFRMLLKWRLKVRELFGFPSKKKLADDAKAALEESVTEVTPMDEELQIQEELRKMNEKESGKKKRERRRENERKTKEIVRMQMHMTAPTEIGLEQAGPYGQDALFGLKLVDRQGAVDRVAKGKMVIAPEDKINRGEDEADSGDDETTDEEEDALDRELDTMYEQYTERRSEISAKYRAKKARRDHGDGDWEGFSAGEGEDSDDEMAEEDDSDDDSEEDEATTAKHSLLTKLENNIAGKDGLTKRAAQFFDQDIFKDIGGIGEDLGDEDGDVDMEDKEMRPASDDEDVGEIISKFINKNIAQKGKGATGVSTSSDSEDDSDGFEVVKRAEAEEAWDDEPEEPLKNGRLGKEVICCFLSRC
jgi:AdoMet-dependent rRNA methyltransferase SPB1